MQQPFRCTTCGALSAAATRCDGCGAASFELVRTAIQPEVDLPEEAELVSLQDVRAQRERRTTPNSD